MMSPRSSDSATSGASSAAIAIPLTSTSGHVNKVAARGRLLILAALCQPGIPATTGKS